MTVSTLSAPGCESTTSPAVSLSLPSDLPPRLRNEVVRVLEIADGYVTELDPNLNFVARLNLLQTVIQWVERAKRDDTPELQVVPGTKDLTWIDFFRALHDHGERLHALPESSIQIAAPSDVLPLNDVIGMAEDLWHRIRLSIESNGSRPDVASELKAAVFGGRPMPRSRAAWVTELGLEINVIETMADPPVHLATALPRLRETKRLMILAVDGRKPPPATTLYSREIHLTSYAIDLALGEFLSWAALQATAQRLQTFRRLIAPRHRRDGTPVLAADPSSEADVDEVLDDPPAEEDDKSEEGDKPEAGKEAGDGNPPEAQAKS